MEAGDGSRQGGSRRRRRLDSLDSLGSLDGLDSLDSLDSNSRFLEEACFEPGVGDWRIPWLRWRCERARALCPRAGVSIDWQRGQLVVVQLALRLIRCV